MQESKVYKLSPAFKNYIWGGDNLKSKWNKSAPFDRVAESWECSTHPDGESRLAELDCTLKDYLASNPDAIGNIASRFEMFPMLIKLIDARDSLSVQVHPSDDYALTNEGQYGKTEMWYIADVDSTAIKRPGIYVGFKRAVSNEEYAAAITNGTLEELLSFHEVKVGESYFIEAGTVHAIGAGVTIIEIQQNSNLTYRVYDYNRVGADGKPRPLHIDKAKLVSKLTPYAKDSQNKIVDGMKLLAKCRYFSVYKANVDSKNTIVVDEQSFRVITFDSGKGLIGGKPYSKGDSFFVPSGVGTVSIEGEGSYILSFVEKV